MNKLTLRVYNLLDLKADTEYIETDFSIRKNSDFQNANSWTLIFAIFIASVGLNTNSTAVIIGAMLISPLMGPIIGAGYGLGINDFELLKSSTRNLTIAVLISLIASSIYFLLSPLSEAHSEILARTSPTFYDVLIAAFGGAAGIIAISRKEKSNAIPGVAIATALMPPLCTAGFGIANLNFNYFIGAIYLFVINSVFICISTYVFVRLLKFKKFKSNNEMKQKKIDRWIMIGGSIVIIPSLFLAWYLHAETDFKVRANHFIETEMRFPNSFILEKKIKYTLQTQKIEVTTVGDSIPESELKSLTEKLRKYGLDSRVLHLNQVSIDEKISKRMEQSKNQVNEQAEFYQAKIKELEKFAIKKELSSELGHRLSSEVVTFSPNVSQLFIKDKTINVSWLKKPTRREKNTIEVFLTKRLKQDNLSIYHLLIQ